MSEKQFMCSVKKTTYYRDMSSNAKRNMKERVRAPRLPRLGSSLGWLRGVLHRGSGLGILVKLPLLILEIFQGRDGNNYGRKRGTERSDLLALENQRWLIRQRDSSGKLRFIETLDHPPTRQELARHGYAQYSVLTTKPALKHWESIVISDKEDAAPQSHTPTLSSSETSKTPRPRLRYRMKKAKVHSQVTPKVHTRTSAENDKTKHAIEMNSLNVTSRIGSKDYLSHSSRTVQQETGFRDSLPDKPEEGHICERCRKLSDSLTRCDFCRETFCSDYLKSCFRDHLCSASKVCHNCNRRVENELAEVRDYCSRYFCSQRCVDDCQRTNRGTDECKTCTVDALIEDLKRKTRQETERTGREEDENGYEDDDMEGCLEEEPSVDTEYEEEEEIEGESYLDGENGDPEEEDGETEVEEMCDGVPKRIACKKCSRSECVSRYCDGICKGCGFYSCDE
jgi:hypothetical protein